MPGRLLGVAVLFLVMLVVALYAASWSKSYQACQDPHANAAAHEKQTYADQFIPVAGGTWIDCEAFFANVNGAAVTGISTVLLTVVTGLLGLIAYLQYAATRNQSRPYVFVLAKEIVEWAPGGPLRIRVELENLGETPAYKLEWAGTASVEAIPLYREKRFLRKKKFMEFARDAPHSVSPIAKNPKEPTSSVDEIPDSEFSPEVLEAIYGGQLGVYIYSHVWHSDVFGGKYEVESCHYIALDDIRLMIEKRGRKETVATPHMQILHAQEFNTLS